MSSSIYNIGVSALNAAQAGITTTQHNIANANTAGYSRQQIVQAASLPQFTGEGFFGRGVNVNAVKRIYDDFLNTQMMQGQASASQLSTYLMQIKQVDNALADPNAGLSTSMQDFFKSMNVVASAPDSVPARQALLSSAQFLTARFQSLNQQLTDMNTSINGQIGSSVTVANSLAQQIASLNQNIVMVQGTSGGAVPNDLLDQRDQLINQLNQEIKVTVLKQQNGAYNVFVGNGQALVVDNQAYGLQAVASLTDPSRSEVAYVVNGATIRMQQGAMIGGKLGGLVSFRDQSLDPAVNSLGRIAIGISSSINQQQRLGQDLNGVMGTNLFSTPSPVVIGATSNTGNAVMSASIANPNALTTSNYMLQANGGTNYTLIRLSDNTVTNITTGLPQTVDGFTINLAAGAAAAGDSFLIRPAADGARSLSVMTSDPAKIAAAAPIRGSAATTNLGKATISNGVVTGPPPTNVNLQAPVTITFNNPPTTYNVSGVGTGAPINVPYVAGATISYNGWTAQISGTPAAGDAFSIVPNTNGTGDNRNALLMANMQMQNTLGGGTASFQGAYAQLVSEVGSKTRETDLTSTAQTNMVSQTMQLQQSQSGVNLDEEAANLMRYQRAYQAAGKAIQVANTMFDTLLALR